MTDTFLRTLHSLITGARSAEEFCHVLVTSATEDALLCVARDFGHDYGVLLRRYRDDIVRRHASGSSVEGGLCRGATKSGKPCTKRAVLHGHCQVHAAAMVKRHGELKKMGAYAAAVPDPSSKFAAEVAMLRGPAASFAVSPDLVDL